MFSLQMFTDKQQMNWCLIVLEWNLSFVKYKHTYSEKMARNGRKKVIYKGAFISIQSLVRNIGRFFSFKKPSKLEIRPNRNRFIKGAPGLDFIFNV